MHTTARGGRTAPATLGYRVLQLIVGIACMVAIANLQYGWTLFVDPINQKYQWSPSGYSTGLHDFHPHGDLARAGGGVAD